jgi:hypothetical protein
MKPLQFPLAVDTDAPILATADAVLVQATYSSPGEHIWLLEG